MNMHTNTNDVMDRIIRIAKGYDKPYIIEKWEIELLTSFASAKLEAGWQLNEVVNYMQYSEHVNPYIDEYTAIAKMSAIYKQVEERLKNT